MSGRCLQKIKRLILKINEKCCNLLTSKNLLYIYIVLFFIGITLNTKYIFFHEYFNGNLKLDFSFFLFFILMVSCLAHISNNYFSVHINEITKNAKNLLEGRKAYRSVCNKAFAMQRYPIFLLSIITALLFSLFMFSNTILELEGFLKLFSFLIVTLMTSEVLSAYVYLIQIILSICMLYSGKFRLYPRVFPAATTIFNIVNKIVAFGLTMFWSIGMILAMLMCFVFDVISNNFSGFVPTLIILLLITIGFIIFTFIPYYLTRKKISQLKYQSIEEICISNKLFNKNEFDEYKDIITFIMASPSNISLNLQIVVFSSFTAILGILTPAITLVKQSLKF